MALERELGTYRRKLPELKEHEGKFVLIHGDEIVDTFSSYGDAIKEGYARFRLEPFLVKQIQSFWNTTARCLLSRLHIEGSRRSTFAHPPI